MTSQRTLRQFYQRFKEEYALLFAGQYIDALRGTMDMLHGMYAYFLRYDAGHEQATLLEFKARPELARMCAFFDEYQWRIDDQQNENCVQPDVLSYIFEQHIHSKQMGVYYTHGDVAEYIVQRAIPAYLLDTVTGAYPTLTAPLQARLLCTQPERYIHEVISSPTYLPTETEREYCLRQARYKQLHMLLQQERISPVVDGITHNLDLQRLVLDMIETCEHPALLLTFYRTLEGMTILDPTCGTGAFLLAAMMLLKELYGACLQRMWEFVERWDEECVKNDPIDVLPEQGHPQGDAPPIDDVNNTYYRVFRAVLAQSIPLVNNLYGIDIMPEAVEVCMMRLSLGLVAQSIDDVPPVGTDVSRPGQQSKGQKDVIHRSLQKPYSFAEDDNRFIRWNIRVGNALEDETWRKIFPGQEDGFDVIIGNPPFVEYSKTIGNGRYGNVYAEVVERSLMLCNRGRGYIGFVVPLSICGGERFDTLRKILLAHTSALWLANFDIFPCRLFEGAYQRLTLVLGKHGGQSSRSNETYVTHIQRWYAPERSGLMKRVVYTRVQHRYREDIFPKLGSWLQEEIIQKMLAVASKNTLSMLVSPVKTEYTVYYQEATYTWVKATRRVPYYRKNDAVKRPPHGRFLYFENEHRASVVCALMNSSLFYLWFATYGDGFHLSHALVQSFPALVAMCEDEQLRALAQHLEEDIQRHAVFSTRNTKAGDKIDIEEYRIMCSKPLIDEIDRVLASYYGFTDEELDLILYFDHKYRMGRA